MPANNASSKDRPYSRKEVVNIIQSALSTIGKETEASKKLYEDLTSLSRYIENTRAELAQMRSIEISHKHIPSATDELDAVVSETAKATGSIMDACEKIEKIAESLDENQRNELNGIITSVYEACSFQDITGQRITKVVKALKNIENKVSEILSAFGHALDGVAAATAATEKPAVPSMLNGPQLKGPATSQEEIDKLLASFYN